MSMIVIVIVIECVILGFSDIFLLLLELSFGENARFFISRDNRIIQHEPIHKYNSTSAHTNCHSYLHRSATILLSARALLQCNRADNLRRTLGPFGYKHHSVSNVVCCLAIMQRVFVLCFCLFSKL